MENYLEELISQARLDIEQAQKRLEMLNALKDSMLENEATVSVGKASQLIGLRTIDKTMAEIRKDKGSSCRKKLQD